MTLLNWGQIAVIVAGYLIAILYQTHHLDSRIDDLRSEMNARFAAIDSRIDDLRSEMNSRFAAIDSRIDDLKDWIRSEFQRVEERIDRAEHPLQRP